MSSFLFPWLNSKIDFLILEQESSAHSQTKNATFPTGLSADFCFLKTYNQTQNLTEKKKMYLGTFPLNQMFQQQSSDCFFLGR